MSNGTETGEGSVLFLATNDIPKLSPRMLAPVVEETKFAALPTIHSVLGAGLLVKLLPMCEL
ncbi:MAG: hypothetical protein RLZZ440_1698 [Planctomycetota bacterium]|jgi:hypothetical protein